MTTLRLAKAVGATQLAIFRHLPTKHDIWLAVADHIAEAMTAAWNAVLDRNVPPQERLVALLQVQLGQIAAILHSRELNVENAALMTRLQTLFVETLSNG